ncbi:hypothetical protein MLD38_010260 [Melastoma candidum]|uniref:Uncharacterized protein n=1 Tax=Melastoma candidum TaxID=119954 RepID=A0ACB9R0K7_9MYRT|nr:hypothetical protein MLD38_010260 [Melastoma candidum]
MNPEEFLELTCHEEEYLGQPSSWCQLGTGGARLWQSPLPYPSEAVMWRTSESPVSAFPGMDNFMGFPPHGADGIGRSTHDETLSCEGITPEFPISLCAEKILINMNNRPETMAPSSARSQNFSESLSQKVSQSRKQSPNTITGNSATTIPQLTKKPRIRWTKYLHGKFVECVNHLGGAENATPKEILKMMGSDGLTASHIKSHLQKYRLYKYAPCTAKEPFPRRNSVPNQHCSAILIREAAVLQLGMLRRLNEQLEIQNNLQARIEEQARELKMMLDQ